MQEDIENRTVNLAISTTKLTGRTMLKGANAWMQHRKAVKAKKENEIPHGKQTVKELVGQNQGVSSIPIEHTDIRDFEKVAKKYGVDFAVTKDKSLTPPRYTVFFKARDADALTAAFTEYSNQKLKAKEKPSVLKALQKLKDRAVGTPDKTRHKSQERDL